MPGVGVTKPKPQALEREEAPCEEPGGRGGGGSAPLSLHEGDGCLLREPLPQPGWLLAELLWEFLLPYNLLPGSAQHRPSAHRGRGISRGGSAWWGRTHPEQKSLGGCSGSDPSVHALKPGGKTEQEGKRTPELSSRPG